MIKHWFLLLLTISTNFAFAQTQTAVLGQKNQIKFSIPNVINLNKCNIEVTLPNQQKVGVEVEGPQFMASLEFTPQQLGNNFIQWEGKMKFQGLNTVFLCPGSGNIQVQVNANTEQITQQWNQYFSRVSEEIGECVKVGMDLSQIKYQSLADPNAILTGPDDAKLKPIYDKCDNFAKQTQPRKAVPCTKENLNNLKTICDGVYGERQSDGQLKIINRARAIQLNFEGRQWTVDYIENAEALATRLKQEEEKDKANKEAEEKDRKLKESPEYKRQQAELERKRIAEEKAAALRAQKEEAELERKRIAEEKAAALKAKKEREEYERAEKERAQREKAAEEAKRALEEKQRLEFAKEFPYYAEITCGANFSSGIPVYSCFFGRNNVNTELEIRNGTEYKMYTAGEIINSRNLLIKNGTLMRINLRQKFDLKVQNSSDSLVMNLKIYNRANQQLVYEKSATQYGVIRASN